MATGTMAGREVQLKLRSGTTYWQSIDGPHGPRARRLHRDESCDVLVIGSGVSGAMAALLLAEAGVDTMVVDRRELVAGSTPASTALVQYDVDLPLVKLARRFDLQTASDIYRANREALNDLRELISKYDIACDCRQRPGVYLAAKPSDAAILRREADARAAAGIEASFLSRSDLRNDFGIDRPAAVRSDVQYEINPIRLTRGLLRHATARGARVYHRTEIDADDVLHRGRPLRTCDGFSIRCRDVIFATGYETPEQFPQLKKLCRLNCTFALASQKLSAKQLWPERALLWEHASPYLYARTTSDDRVLVGGEDVRFKNPRERDAKIAAKTRAIVKKFKKLYDVNIRPAMTWAGTFAETADGLPLIGRPRGVQRCYFALGYGGNGITYSLIAAQIIRDRILRRKNEIDRLFTFDRLGSSASGV